MEFRTKNLEKTWILVFGKKWDHVHRLVGRLEGHFILFNNVCQTFQ